MLACGATIAEPHVTHDATQLSTPIACSGAACHHKGLQWQRRRDVGRLPLRRPLLVRQRRLRSERRWLRALPAGKQHGARQLGAPAPDQVQCAAAHVCFAFDTLRCRTFAQVSNCTYCLSRRDIWGVMSCMCVVKAELQVWLLSAAAVLHQKHMLSHRTRPGSLLRNF